MAAASTTARPTVAAVRGIPDDADVASVTAFFSRFGAVENVDLSPAASTPRRRRTADIFFADAAGAAACKAAHGAPMSAGAIDLDIALAIRSPTRVFVGNLDPSATAEDLAAFFGAGNVANIERGRRFAHVDFVSPAAAAAGLAKTGGSLPVDPERKVRIISSRIVVDEDGVPLERAPRSERAPRRSGPSKVFISGLAAGTTDEQIAAAFGGDAAGVTRVRLDADNGRAFVDFSSASAAATAAETTSINIAGAAVTVAPKGPSGISIRGPRTDGGAAASSSASGAVTTRVEPANPCEVYVVASRSKDDTRDLVSAYGEIESLRAIARRRSRPAPGALATQSYIVRFATASQAAAAIAGLPSSSVTVDVLVNEDGTDAAGATATVTVVAEATKERTITTRARGAATASGAGAGAGKGRGRGRGRGAARAPLTIDDSPANPSAVFVLSGPDADAVKADCSRFGTVAAFSAHSTRRPRAGIPSSRSYLVTFGSPAAAAAAIAGLNGTTISSPVIVAADGSTAPEGTTGPIEVIARPDSVEKRTARARARMAEAGSSPALE